MSKYHGSIFRVRYDDCQYELIWKDKAYYVVYAYIEDDDPVLYNENDVEDRFKRKVRIEVIDVKNIIRKLLTNEKR